MTVLYSFYSSAGIVFAADRRLTARVPQMVRGKRITSQFYSEDDPKILRGPIGVHHDGGLIGYFGHALAGKTPMHDWLAEFCANWSGSREPRTFCAGLVEALKAAGHPWTKEVTGFHIGAFVTRGGRETPTFWFVRNGQISPATAGYHVFNEPHWAIEEQLTDRDFLGLSPRQLQDALRLRETQIGVPYWYSNGDLSAFAHVRDSLERAAAVMIRQPGYKAPANLDDWTRVAEAFVVAAISLADATFKKGAPRIGGVADALTLSWGT